MFVIGKDILTQYTKMRNKECGRNGYYASKREKETIISPKDYGMFLERKKKIM